MASGSSSLRQKRLGAVPGLMVLGIWQLRQVWRLFVLVTLGMVAAVMLVCALPLFTIVSTTAGMRNTFNNGLFDPTSSVQMEATVASSTEIRHTISVVTQEYRQKGGTFFSLPPVVSLHVPYSSIAQNNQLIRLHIMQLHGYDTASLVSRLPLTQGHLPQANANSLEIALSDSNVRSLNAHLGSTYTIYVYPPAAKQPVPIQLTVVGIFQEVSFLDPYWHGDSFLSLFDPATRTTRDNAIISNSALLHLYDLWTQKAGGKALQFPTAINYSFPLDITAVNSTNLDKLKQRLDKLTLSLPTVVNQSAMQSLTMSNTDLLTLISAAKDQTSVTQIPVLLLLALMLGLILFFAHIMTELLVTRQVETVAMSRARGATLSQIFLVFVSQSLLLGLLTLLLTPILLMLFIHFPIQIILSGTDQRALNALPTAPWDFALLLGWYPIVAVIVAVGAMCAAIWRTLTSSTLGRSTTIASRPFWERIYLDLFFLLLGGLFYGVYSYLASTGLIDAQLQVLLTGPCLLVGTLLVCIGCVLLCMRGFPRLVQLGARLAGRRRGIVPMLPLVLLARAPRQGLRATLLLAMTIAFTLFVLVFTATQAQRVSDLANYRVGADFSGIMEQAPVTYKVTTVNGYISTFVEANDAVVNQTRLQSSYQHVPGVLSASVGYNVAHTFSQAEYPLNVVAIDPAKFLSAVIWPREDNSPDAHLIAQLASERSLFGSQQPNSTLPALPAILDATTAQQLHVTIGQQFILTEFGAQMSLVDIGEIAYLPSVNDEIPLANGGGAGMLVDYASFANAYQRFLPNSGENLNPNTVWLHTRQDATTLSIVRRTLANGPLALETLNDRLGLVQSLRYDPLYLNIQFALVLGIGLSLLLALIGYITSMWLSVRKRRQSLVVLRSLGMSPGQLIALLASEQGFTSVFAIVVGIASGVLFTALALPSLVFSGLAQTGALSTIYTSHVYLLQFAPPLQVMIPGSLLIGLGAVIVLCLVALGIMTYTASRPLLAQALRLEEYVEEVPLFVAQPVEKAAQAMPVSPTISPVLPGGARVARRQEHGRWMPGRSRLSAFFSTRALTPVRRIWGYLTLTMVGMMVLVLLVCVVPLFSQIAATAGLRDLLAQPTNRYAVVSDALTSGFYRYGVPLATVTQQVSTTQEHLDTALLAHNQSFFHDAAIVKIRGAILKEKGGLVAPAAGQALTFVGVSLRRLAANAHIVQGRMPQPASLLQIALTPADAARLHVSVGETLTPQMGYSFPMQVVGLFQPLASNDAFIAIPQNTSQGQDDVPPDALVSAEGFLQAIAQQAQLAGSGDGQLLLAGEVDWYYPIDHTHVTINQLDIMLAAFSTLTQNGVLQKSGLPIDALTQYQTSVQITQVPIMTTSVLIIGLVLLFLLFIVELLVEMERTTIAVLSSRGATRRQIFAAFFMRMLLLSGGSVLLSLPLVIPVVEALAHFALSLQDQSALQQVTGNPLRVILSLFPSILISLSVMMVALSFVLYHAIGVNILTLRQETARSTYKPLWQRYYLDVAGIMLALVAYGASLYVTRAGILSPQVSVLIKSPLVAVTTLCLVLACMLVFLRLFPSLLRWGTVAAVRNSNRVELMLTFSQMARAPRQHIRIVLLLLITTAFAVFGSVFIVSQNQHISDVTRYWTGADFSGPLAAPVAGSRAHDLQATYDRFPGVASVAAGSLSTITDDTGTAMFKMVAVDPANFFQTVDWQGGMTSQRQNALIQGLTDQRTYFAKIASGSQSIQFDPGSRVAIPVVVDAPLWNAYQLSVGQIFNLSWQSPLIFVAIGEVNYIPSSYDSSQFANGSLPTMIADYQSLADYETALTYLSGQQAGSNNTNISINYIWLKTSNNVGTLADVRQAAQVGPFPISQLSDRYAMLQELTNDPLNRNLVGILLLGALTPLVLAWIGCLLAYRINVRQRRVLFGVLRALGGTPGLLARVLLWEQSLIYGTAIVLGVFFGLLTAVMALPSLVMTSALPGGSGTSNLDLFTLQNLPPVHIVIAPSLALAIGCLILLGIVTLAFMYSTTSRLLLAQALRVNQD